MGDVSVNFIADQFTFDPAISVESKFDFVLGLENFVTIVKNIVCDNMATDLHYKGFERNSAPDLDVYRYIGHNKVDLKKDSINYSLLFK